MLLIHGVAVLVFEGRILFGVELVIGGIGWFLAMLLLDLIPPINLSSSQFEISRNGERWN